ALCALGAAPEAPDKQALESLRTTLYRLRQSLDKVSPRLSHTLITATHQTIRFSTNTEVTIQTDVIYFQTLLAACKAHPHDQLSGCPVCLERLNQAIKLYQGELLTGFSLADALTFEEWLLFQREMLHQQILLALKTLADEYEAIADHDQAFSYTNRLLKLDPYREASHRQLMRLLAKQNLPDQALAQFVTFQQILRDEVGVEPEAETLSLVEQIRRGVLNGTAEGTPLSSPIESTEQSSPGLDGREIPLVGTFFGRAKEQALLQQWLETDRCQLVTILGIGGQGKTTLAAQVTRHVAEQFDLIIWRSLLNAPTLEELLPNILTRLNGEPLKELPAPLDEKLALLRHYLQEKRCLLVLDNMETILQSEPVGRYQPGYSDYGQLIQELSRYNHSSCLLLTSRERPEGLKRIERTLPTVQSLMLTGLEATAGQEILQTHGLALDTDTAIAMTNRYSGNPLALNLVAETIQDIYFGDVDTFLDEETPVFADIRDVLDQQFNRLSPLERDILLWLAITREALLPTDLSALLLQKIPQRALIESIRGLQHRSLLERNNQGFLLQNVVTEYLTEFLIQRVSQELEQEQPDLLYSHALIRAQSKAYIRQSQARLSLTPIGERLLGQFNKDDLAIKSQRMLNELREKMSAVPSYAAGNILNLLLHMNIDVTGFDFSHLAVHQAYLQNANLYAVNLSHADLSQSVFTDTFDEVPAVAVSPDGNLVAAGANDGTLRLWQAATGQPIRVIQAHTNTVRTLAVSPDGTIIASGSFDHTVRLWDMSSGQLRYTLQGHSDAILSVDFSPDGQTVATGSADHTVRLWNTQTGQCEHSLSAHTGWVYGVVFSPNGKFLATGSADHTVCLWAIETRKLKLTLEGHTGEVLDVAISPDGRWLASGSADQTIRLWPVVDDTILETENRFILKGHTNSVATLAFSPDSQMLASGGYDHIACLWNISQLTEQGQGTLSPANNGASNLGQLRHILRADDWIESLVFSPDGQTLVTGGLDRVVRLWNTHTGQLQTLFQGNSTTAYAVSFSPDGQWLVSGNADRSVCVWDANTKEVRHILHGHCYLVRSVDFSPNGQILASGSEDKTIHLWNIRTGQLRQIIQGNTDRIISVAFSPDGQILASASDDSTINVWDANTGQLQQVLNGHTERVTSVAFRSDGQILASGSNDRTLRLWRINPFEISPIPYILKGHLDWIRAIAFSPDGQTLASGSTDYTIRLWNLVQILDSSNTVLKESDSELFDHTILSGHTNWVNAIAFSPEGQLLASGSSDHTVRLWDVETGQHCLTLEGHTHWVLSIAFSPDGDILASGSGDETVRLWDVETGICLNTLEIPGPYEGLNIAGVTGITEAQRSALKALGALEEDTPLLNQ
ncbi:MAG: BTAD domain-containing putative transcriptional regulator, partial [Chloroflexota bacterium]